MTFGFTGDQDEQGDVPLVTDVNGKVLAYVRDVDSWCGEFLEPDGGSETGREVDDEEEPAPRLVKGVKQRTKAKSKGKQTEIASRRPNMGVDWEARGREGC